MVGGAGVSWEHVIAVGSMRKGSIDSKEISPFQEQGTRGRDGRLDNLERTRAGWVPVSY